MILACGSSNSPLRPYQAFANAGPAANEGLRGRSANCSSKWWPGKCKS